MRVSIVSAQDNSVNKIKSGNIRLILSMDQFPLLILFTLLSCADTIETRIPYRAVYLELDLTYQDKALNAIQAYKIYTSKDVDQAGEQTGFGGVLVYHGLSSNGTGAFFAFDAACPHEASANVIVDVDESAVYAICPKCGSKFELLNGIGNQVEGPCAEEKQALYQLSYFRIVCFSFASAKVVQIFILPNIFGEKFNYGCKYYYCLYRRHIV